MKVQDIRSFFKQPKTDSNFPALTSPVVEVPTTTRRRKDSAAKEKKAKADSLSQSQIEEDESESEKTKKKGRGKISSMSKDKRDKEKSDSSKKRNKEDDEEDFKDNRKSKSSGKKGDDEDDSKDKKKSRVSEKKDDEKASSSKKKSLAPDDDEPTTSSKAKKQEQAEKPKHEKKRKSRVLSDSEEEEDFSVNKSGNKSTLRSSPRKQSGKSDANILEDSKSSPSKDRKEMKEDKPQRKESSASSSAKEKLSKYDKNSIQTDSVAVLPKREKVVSEKETLKSPPTKEKSSREATSSRSSTKVDSPTKQNGKSHSSVSNSKASTPVAEKKKIGKRPSNSIDDGSDSDDGFNPRGKAPPAKKSKVSVPEMKTPTRNTQNMEEKTPDQKKEQNKAAFFKFMSRNQTPRNLGSKELPIGAADCLAGLTFVMTGVLDSLEREDAKEFITKYGGRVTGSISGKTSYVIIGEEAGESKLKKAASLKVPQISEDDLLEMVRKSNPNQTTSDPFEEDEEEAEKVLIKVEKESQKRSPSKSKTPTASPTKSKKSTPTKDKITPLSPTTFKIPTSTSKGKPQSPSKSVEKDMKPKPSTSTSSSVPSAETPKLPISSNGQPSAPSLMWVDKYKPKALKDVVGQAGDASNAKKLLKWLRNWFQHHGSSTDKAKASWPGLRDPEGKTFKCALLSGPPGIGKTTTAHLVCREVGYDYFEMNASDTRNKRGLKENIADALSSKCITFGNKKDELTRKHVLIMDEVDGMSGNEDRGGVQELIALIKSSRIPIICICNDRNHPKIRSLANYCFDLRFAKPSFGQLKSFMMSMCFKEKIKILPEKLQQLIISTDQDVRQIIHQLELYKDAKCDAAYNPRKDLSFGPWDVVRKVFSAPDRVGMSIHDKTGLFFQDYSIGPLFVQENYIRYVPQAAKGNVFKHMDILKATAESVADGDLVDSILRKSNNWSLLPVQAVFASYAPGEYMDGHCSSGPQFPMWLGKNSNKNKRARLLQQLHSHMHLNVSGSLEALNMEYLPFLRRSIINPLVNGDVQDSVQLMEDYNLIREDLDNINELTLWPGMKNNMDRVDSKTKAAFTRQVNKEILPYSVMKVTKARGKGQKDEEDLEGLEDDDGVAENSEEEEETLDKDAMVKVKTKTASKKATASSSKSKSKRSHESDSEEETSTKNSKGGRKAGSSSKASTSKKSRK